MRNLFERYAELPFLKKTLWKIWHNFLLSRDREFEIKFMNYGYVEVGNGKIPLKLDEADEPERYCINLYHQNVADVNIDIVNKNLLEVGCGRGGGASYIARYLKPKSFIGLDLSKKAIKFCNAHYNVPGLSFTRGNAEDLPFDDNSFDAVVNVESSRCYPHMSVFLSEVYRVLRPGGFLLFSDMRTQPDNQILQEQFRAAQLSIISEQNILPNVLAALKIDSKRREELISRKAPKFLRKSASEFSGVVGTERFRLFADGEMGYYHYVLQKPS